MEINEEMRKKVLEVYNDPNYMTDRAMAKKIGMSYTLFYRYRVALGLLGKSWAKLTNEEAKFALRVRARKTHKRWKFRKRMMGNDPFL